ncbi:transcription factor SOX-4-like [Triticum urartu]|uniref:transcription factor SOX-4-like n=1 Tax=Triticum urartu TaxID=4572 RepID=UPI0020445186|nr:transcription factor SOX-4-like [Triticum urartu]
MGWRPQLDLYKSRSRTRLPTNNPHTRPAQVPQPQPHCAALHWTHGRARAAAGRRGARGRETGAAAMVEGGSGAGATSTCRRGGGGGGIVGPAARRCCGGGCGLGRLVRRLRRQGRQALCAARPAAASSSSSAAGALRGCQYDPLSYARNFDQSGFGDPDPDADAASLYYSYTFSSRFVLAPGSAASSAASVAAVAPAPNGLVVASRPTAASH